MPDLMQMQCACLPFLVRDARLFADLCYELTAASTKLIVRSISGLFCIELMFGQDINCSPQVRLHPRSQTHAYRARMQTPQGRVAGRCPHPPGHAYWTRVFAFRACARDLSGRVAGLSHHLPC